MLDSVSTPPHWDYRRHGSGEIEWYGTDGDTVSAIRDPETGLWSVSYEPNVEPYESYEHVFESKTAASMCAEATIDASEHRGVDAARTALEKGGGCPGRDATSLATPLTVRDAVNQCPFCGGPTGDAESPSGFRCEASGDTFYIE